MAVIFRDDTDRGTFSDVEAGYHLPDKDINPATILDLGCHAGYTILDFLDKYPGAAIWAVEMDADNFKTAVDNVFQHGLRRMVKLYRYAITDWDGKCSYTDGASNAHEVCAIDGDTDCLTMDSLMKMVGQRIDYAKFDIEGQERAVFKQGGNWTTMVRSLKAELHGDYTVEQASADLFKLGYNTSPGKLHPNSVFAWK